MKPLTLKPLTYVERKPRITAIPFAPNDPFSGFDPNDWYYQLVAGHNIFLSDTVKFRNRNILIQDIATDSITNVLTTLTFEYCDVIEGKGIRTNNELTWRTIELAYNSKRDRENDEYLIIESVPCAWAANCRFTRLRVLTKRELLSKWEPEK